jgi:subtilase family serine protease
VPAGLRPVGQRGSHVPILEPGHNGSVWLATSPQTARHTISAVSADSGVTPPGYSPAQMNGYLGLTGDGKGQKIAIVDAYNDPDIASDAETFSQQYGLPGVCGAGGTSGDCFNLDISEQSATAGPNDNASLETSLDVEWAHAIAPEATIELFEAKQLTFASLFAEVKAAEATRPDAVSMSWGVSGGDFSEETYYDHFCVVLTTVCVVASGDLGHPGSYPAYNPAVLSVGGTTLNLAADNSVASELSWAGSGGGQSWVEPEPSYQDGVQSSGWRQTPDVSFDADPNTGVAVFDTLLGGWWLVGGTSLGAPSWSAILADADQLRAEQKERPLTAANYAVQRAIYSLPASVLAPITTGADNGFCPVGCTPTTGYDEITGLGSPRPGIDTALAAAPG